MWQVRILFLKNNIFVTEFSENVKKENLIATDVIHILISFHGPRASWSKCHLWLTTKKYITWNWTAMYFVFVNIIALMKYQSQAIVKITELWDDQCPMFLFCLLHTSQLCNVLEKCPSNLQNSLRKTGIFSVLTSFVVFRTYGQKHALNGCATVCFPLPLCINKTSPIYFFES